MVSQWRTTSRINPIKITTSRRNPRNSQKSPFPWKFKTGYKTIGKITLLWSPIPMKHCFIIIIIISSSSSSCVCLYVCVYTVYIQTHILYIQYIVSLLCTVAMTIIFIISSYNIIVVKSFLIVICSDLHFIHSCLLSNFNFRFIFQLKVVMLWFISGWFSLWLNSSLKNVLKTLWRKWIGKTLPKAGPLANVWSPLCSIVPWQASVSVITHSSETQCAFIVLYWSSASQLTLNPNFTINTKVINDLKGTLVSYMLLSAICGLWSAAVSSVESYSGLSVTLAGKRAVLCEMKVSSWMWCSIHQLQPRLVW